MSETKSKRILVTGGAGFIGSFVVDALLQSGIEVTVIDEFNDSYSPAIKRGNLAHALENPGFDLVEGDLCDPKILEEGFRIAAPDAVIHLAARAGVRPSILDPKLYFRVNCMGSLSLFEACLRHRVARVVFASSSSVYGEAETVPFQETMRVDRPVSPYAGSKQAGELLAHTFASVHGMNIACLRFFTVYGPRQRPEMAIHSFMRSIQNEEELTVFGDGSSSRDYTYVSDIVRGILLALEKNRGFRIYNVGSGSPIQLLPLIDTIGEIIGKKPRLRWAPNQKGDVSRTFADVSRSQKELGFSPEMTLRSGLEAMYEWLSSKQ